MNCSCPRRLACIVMIICPQLALSLTSKNVRESRSIVRIVYSVTAYVHKLVIRILVGSNILTKMIWSC
ncbi:hypothetical protein M758_8G095100 [Ceratodon purpureus]|uniref:Secreted protein n=1 Tax=Ceratodon purpureus TaxID=3225 RepID=A0A8T0GZJ1_CERPU|nr:hypothetical protein KC19_8G098600 [Ceratodon purpureus]KAG0608296.1 hypothetical protein M758_8G095100 [Ceratodon purpureus]